MLPITLNTLRPVCLWHKDKRIFDMADTNFVK
jgi:hypothetical protein